MRIAMQNSAELDYLDTASMDDDEHEAEPKSPEDLVDRLGFKVALSVLVVVRFAGRYCATAAQLGMEAKKTSLAVWAAFCPVQER